MYKPVPELPGLYHLSFNDAPGYATTIAVMDNAIMVVDAPAHQSKLVIQYVQQTFNRNVTHLLVSYIPRCLWKALLTVVFVKVTHHHRTSL